jgi:glycosyltransferase involved in cell wall biosynthesis
MKENSVKLSIIISIYSINRYLDLLDLLRAIKNQTSEWFECIVVVDENEILLKKIDAFLLYQDIKCARTIYNSKNKGLAYSRNIGIKHARGEIVGFIDDDAIPFPKWADSIIETFNDETIGAVAGEIIPLWEYEEMSWFPKILYWMISCSYKPNPGTKVETERGFGTNMAFRKDLVNSIGGFDVNLGINGKKWIGGEDTSMFLRVKASGKKVVFDPDVIVWHKITLNRINLINIMKRAINGGISLAALQKAEEYNVKKSTETDYLRKIFSEFFPNSIKYFVNTGSLTSLKQMFVVGMVVSLEGLGYAYGLIKFRPKKGTLASLNYANRTDKEVR